LLPKVTSRVRAFLTVSVKLGCRAAALRYVVLVDWEQITSLLIVVATAAVLAWRKLRPLKPGIQTGCGCGHSCAIPDQDRVPKVPSFQQTGCGPDNFVKKF
jgi:hypothetical protein